MVVWRVLNAINSSLYEREVNNICKRAIEKRNNQIVRGMQLPSPFAEDLMRTLSDAKALAQTAMRNKST
jgi:hypothetical protein